VGGANIILSSANCIPDDLHHVLINENYQVPKYIGMQLCSNFQGKI